jgi:hypothetical protein
MQPKVPTQAGEQQSMEFHITYMDDLPPTINTLAMPIIFADDTSIIISSKNLEEFCELSTGSYLL